MNINDFDFHDAELIGVREIEEQTIEFLTNFCTDWQNNIFEKRILRFKGFISYNIDEIPFGGRPTILEIVDFGQFTKTFGTGTNQIETVRNKIEIQTNAGNRTIEYSEFELITP